MTLASGLLFALALVFAGAAGASLLAGLVRTEPDSDSRADLVLSFGLPVGLVLLAMPGWLLSAAMHVPVGRVALPLAAAAGAALLVFFGRNALEVVSSARRALAPAAVFLVCFLFFLWLRWPAGDIRHTEQPMDFAVLSGLMVTPSLPFPDPWMAGERFPYYHFASYVFSLPLRVSGIAPEYGYNLVAALLPALAGLAAFGAARSRGAGRRIASVAAWLVVGTGTFDALRQLLARTRLVDIDFWFSSRRVDNPHAITEWPLFTYRLGDLHPHAVEFPFLVTLAGLAGRVGGWGGVVLDGALVAAVVSANPWDLPAALLLVGAGNLMEREIKAAIFRTAATLLAAAPFMLTFVTSPRPALKGLDFVAGSTAAVDAFLHFGTFAAAIALAAGVALARSRKKSDEALLAAVAFPALGLALALLLGKPVFGLAVGFVAAAAFLLFRRVGPGDATANPEGALRAGFLYAVVGATLASVPDIVLVADAYGNDLKRMNTVFKCFMGAWPAFALGVALLLPLTLATRRARLTIRAILLVCFAGSLIHPLAAIAVRFASGAGTLDGIAWMSREAPGDRKAIDWLRKNASPAAVIAEASGNPYSDYGRVGNSSGRPQVLGWANHENVWRGGSDRGELGLRQAALKRLYTTTSLDEARQVIAKYRIRYVVVGSLERKDFAPAPFPLGIAFKRVFEELGTTLYEVGP